MESDRRRADRDRRQEWRVPVVCAIRNTVGGSPHLGQSEDIGPAGITVRRPRGIPVPPETPIGLTFEIPGEIPGTQTTMNLEGLVVSDRRYGSFRRTGIRFRDATPEQLALLRRLKSPR